MARLLIEDVTENVPCFATAYRPAEVIDGGEVCIEVHATDDRLKRAYLTLSRAEAAGLIAKLAHVLAAQAS